MALLSWTRPGLMVRCIDDAWVDVLCGESKGPAPVKGQDYVITSAEVVDGEVYITLEGFPHYHELAGFRPLSPFERDIAMFQRLANNAKAPALEPELIV